MKDKFLLSLFLLMTGCYSFPPLEYRYLPDHTDAALLKKYEYLSNTSTSVTYTVQISTLAWYNDETDIGLLNEDIKFEGDGIFKILDNQIETTSTVSNSSTVLLIDQSGSYSEIDPYNNRSKAINKFLEDFNSPNEFLLGGFSKSGRLMDEPAEYGATDFKSVWDYPSYLFGLAKRTGGDCDLYEAMDDAIDHLLISSKPYKNIVLMTHAPDAVSSLTATDVITKAMLNGVNIHMLIFGSQPLASDVWSLSEQTGGMFIVCPNDSEMITVFDHMERLLHAAVNVSKLTIEFTPTSGSVVSGNEFENKIFIKDYLGAELNPVYVKVKIP